MAQHVYLIETVDMFRMRYLVEAPTQEEAMSYLVSDGPLDWQQQHLTEVITSVRTVSLDDPELLREHADKTNGGQPGLPIERCVTRVRRITQDEI